MKIKTDDIKNTVVSYFRDAHTRDHTEVTLYECLVTIPEMYRSWYESLRALPEEEQKQRKVFSPLFVCSAVCGKDENGVGTRKHEYVVKKNNLIVIDIDKGDNDWLTGETLDKVKQALFSMNYVYAVSKSIRGNGLFVVIPIENADNIREHFNAIEQEFLKAGIVIDKSCKDLTRSRFLSYDPDILIKEDTEVEVYDKRYNPNELDEYTQKILDQRREFNKIRYGQDDKRLMYAMDMLFDECNYCGTGDYNDWIHEAFMLTSLVDRFGYSYCHDKFMIFSRNTPGFKNPDDVTRKFENIYNSHKKMTDIDGYYFGKLKRQLGNDWIKLLNEYIEKREINNK